MSNENTQTLSKDLTALIKEKKANISDFKKNLKADIPIKEKIKINFDIREIKEEIADIEKQKTDLKKSKMAESNKTNQETKAPKAPKKEKAPKEDPTIEGRYFEDGKDRKKSEVFANPELKAAYQKERKKERRAARQASKKTEDTKKSE